MALTITQGVAVSYPAVLAEMRQAANQWAESAFLAELDNQGGIERKSLGETIEAPLDYRANPGAGFLASDLQPVDMTKTEVITSASYAIAQLSAPMVWSKMDEVKNPSENQKIPLIKNIIVNGINSHDDLLEQAFFATTTQGFLGLLTHVTTAGTGSDGGIDSTTETWWRNQQATYVDDTDIVAAMTTVYNACAKGSGAKLIPKLLVSDGATNAIFEGTQQSLQRWSNTNKINAGAKQLMFKDATYVFSQYASTSIFFLNTQNIKLVVSKEYFRDREETQPLQNANGFISKIYSACQFLTNNRSRLGCAHL